jgi:hypothetical protein
MKNIVRIALSAIMMVMCTTAVMAQSNISQQRISREELAQRQAEYISRQLALQDAVSQQFVATYVDYQKEVWALGPRLHRDRQQQMTDAEAEQAIKQRMERSQKILDLREKYYGKYSQFLSPKQIERVYELERQAMQRLARHGKTSHRHQQKTRRN